MALISSKDSRRIIPPHEPDSWFDVIPMRAGDVKGLTLAQNDIGIGLEFLHNLIQGWSYEEPVTRESVASLDLDTYVWLVTEIKTLSNIRGDSEKKDSGSS